MTEDHVTAVALARVDRGGPDGAVWSLPHDGDLDANLVKLGAGGRIGAHRNDEVDVLLVVVAGEGVATVDDAEVPLEADTLILVRKGTWRAIAASPDGDLVYLSVHRARTGLQVGPRPPHR